MHSNLMDHDEEVKVDLYSSDLTTGLVESKEDINHSFCCGVDVSTVLIGFITFTGDSSRGILFPVLWNLTQELGGNVVDLGYIVAMFSIGRLIVTTPLGYLSDKFGHKLPLTMCSFTLTIGAILWANAYLTKNISCLYLAQLIMGFGSGTLGLTRSYVVEKVDPTKRTYILGLLTALQYSGFTMSPVFGSLFSTIGSSTGSGYLTYALPGYLIGIMALISLIGLLTVFKNIENSQIQILKTKAVTSPSSDLMYTAILIKQESEETDDQITKRNLTTERTIRFLIHAFILLNVTTKGSIAVYETLGAQILENDYGFTVFAVGVLISICGTIGTAQLLMFKSFWTKYFNDIELMLGGIAVMVLAQMFIIAYDGNTPDRYRYITGVVLMYGIGYPIGHTAVLGAFSKIQKTGPQAALMGWFATFGSVARVILPIGSGYLDSAINNSPFNLVMMLLSASYLAIVHMKNDIWKYILGIQVPPQETRFQMYFELFQLLSMAILFFFAFYSMLWLTPVEPGSSVLITK